MDDVKGLITDTVHECIRELAKRGMLKDTDAVAYNDINDMLSGYYRSGENDKALTYAIQAQRFDPYFRIIPMYFKDEQTVDVIAKDFGVDISTIVRNKKRLCLAIYHDII